MIELDPERLALKVFEPAVSQKPTPVLADPHPDGHLTQVAPGFLTLDPLVTQGFFFSALVKTHATGGRVIQNGFRSTRLGHRDLRAELRSRSIGDSQRISVSRGRRVHASSSESALVIYAQTTTRGLEATRFANDNRDHSRLSVFRRF